MTYRREQCATCGQEMWFPDDDREIVIEHVKGVPGTLLPFDMHIINRSEHGGTP